MNDVCRKKNRNNENPHGGNKFKGVKENPRVILKNKEREAVNHARTQLAAAPSTKENSVLQQKEQLTEAVLEKEGVEKKKSTAPSEGEITGEEETQTHGGIQENRVNTHSDIVLLNRFEALQSLEVETIETMATTVQTEEPILPIQVESTEDPSSSQDTKQDEEDHGTIANGMNAANSTKVHHDNTGKQLEDTHYFSDGSGTKQQSNMSIVVSVADKLDDLQKQTTGEIVDKQATAITKKQRGRPKKVSETTVPTVS